MENYYFVSSTGQLFMSPKMTDEVNALVGAKILTVVPRALVNTYLIEDETVIELKGESHEIH